jgi:ketosteroid isomerase-like protein
LSTSSIRTASTDGRGRTLGLAVLPVLILLVTACQQTGAAPANVAASSSDAVTQPSETRSPTAVTNPETNDSRAQILAVAGDRNRGMLERDIALLDQILADDFIATHITGYQQPKQEWLDQINSGEMQYHSIREIDTDLDVDGQTAVAITRNAVDATINGSRNTWNLRSTTRYEVRDGSWKIVASTSTTF